VAGTNLLSRARFQVLRQEADPGCSIKSPWSGFFLP